MLNLAITQRLGDFRLDVGFDAPPRQVTVLFGASGAGKSATLACIAGASRPDAGRITLNGRVLFDGKSSVPMERRRIGWVFQDARLFPHLTVAGNLAYGARRAAGEARIAQGDVVEVLGIGGLLDRLPRDLSGGERQRVGLGRALLSQPDLLLMDEPLAALDAPRKAEILPFLDRLKGAFALPVLYVTHSLAEAVRLGDRMVVLEGGRVAADGPLAEVVGRPDLPLVAGRSEAGSVLEATVAATDAGRGLTRLTAGAWDLWVPGLAAPVGASARAFILARDVMLALDRPQRISARNVLGATVTALSPQPGGKVLATVEARGARLLASLTDDAVSDLALTPGMAVWAVVKSVAIEGGDGGLLGAIEG